MYTNDEIKVKLQQVYQKKVPSKTIQITNVEQITSGWETDIYSFTAEGGEPSQLILRMYPGIDGPQKAAREFHAMDQLHKVGYPVPKVHILEVSNTFGKPFIIMEKINGQIMWSLMNRSPEKKELITLFCTLFCDLHRIDWNPFTRLSRYSPDPYAFITHSLKRGEEYLTAFGKHEFIPVLEWLKKRRSTVPCQRLSVTHGDYHPNNVIVHNGKAFVIDWSQVDVADFRFDIAWTVLLMGTYGKAEFRDIILSEYEKIAGCTIEHLEYFDVLASLKRLFTISASLSKGAAELGMRPGAEKMMKGNVAHIQKVYSLLWERTGITIPEVEELISSLY